MFFDQKRVRKRPVRERPKSRNFELFFKSTEKEVGNAVRLRIERLREIIRETAAEVDLPVDCESVEAADSVYPDWADVADADQEAPRRARAGWVCEAGVGEGIYLVRPR